MSEITTAIQARQAQITQLQREIETLQHAAGLVGGKAPAKAQPKTKSKKRGKKATKVKRAQPKAAAKSKVKAKTNAKAKKRHQWTAAEKAAIGKRMKAFWAKRRKAKR